MYYKTRDSARARVSYAKDGAVQMEIEGERYKMPGFPRGQLLDKTYSKEKYSNLSKLKHTIKNKVFNESWQKLEDGIEHSEIIGNIKSTLFEEIVELFKLSKYDVLPLFRMCTAVKEIHRAWTVVSPHSWQIRDYLCFILQEDDAYRMRVQWLVEWFEWPKDPIKSFDYALSQLEHGEVIGDMKGRVRLLRRILMLMLTDKSIKKQFIAFFHEIDWKKIRLTKADKYYFRGKYFKVDLGLVAY